MTTVRRTGRDPGNLAAYRGGGRERGSIAPLEPKLDDSTEPARLSTDGAAMPRRRDRQFKLRLSYEEWDALLGLVEIEGLPAADILRRFILRRYDQLCWPGMVNLHAAADTLSRVATGLRSVAETLRIPGKEGSG